MAKGKKKGSRTPRGMGGGGMGGGMGNLMNQMQKLQEDMEKTQAELEEEELTVTADLCGKEGMRVGYHAHPFDFARIGGRTAWEILFSHAGPEVIMQMDVGNCLGGGGDPIAMLKQFPGRAKTVHIKEYEEKTFDSDYYKQVFRLCETSGGTQWYIVEMGDPGGNGLRVPRSALRKLHRLGH